MAALWNGGPSEWRPLGMAGRHRLVTGTFAPRNFASGCKVSICGTFISGAKISWNYLLPAINVEELNHTQLGLRILLSVAETSTTNQTRTHT